MLGNGHRRLLTENIRGAYISSWRVEVKENLRGPAVWPV
ncbi:hypothetical protein C7S15_5746 [Burkholderia cepacia]|nr:hypothetical protein [Burkholderia cepacia]